MTSNRLRGALIAATMLTAPVFMAPGMAMAAEAAADAGAASLSELTVTAKRVEQTAGTKTDLTVAETPQSLSVITAEVIALRGAQSLQDVLGYVAGVRADAYGQDSRVDSFNMRGTSGITQFLDGMRLVYGSYNVGKVDPYALERVEVLRGPASMLYGQGSIAGIVNMVTKRPGQERQGEVTLSYGSFDRKQAQIDVTGPLDAEGKFAFRLTSLLRKAGNQVDYVNDDRWFVAPSIAWRPTDAAEVTVMLHHQMDRSVSSTQFVPWEGRIFDNPNGQISSSLFAGEPGWDRYDTNQTNLTIAGSYKFNEDWQIRTNARSAWAKVWYQTIYSNSFTRPTSPFLTGGVGYTGPMRAVTRSMSGQFPTTLSLSADTQLQGKVATGPLEHTLLLGADIQDFKQKYMQVTARTLTNGFDLFNPVYGNYTITPRVRGNTTKQDQLGFYLQDQIKLGELIVMAGVRHDRARSETITPANVRTKKKDTAETYRLGALYTFANGLAPYVSYAESFVPVAGTNLAGEAFVPQVGRQYEAGVKFQPTSQYLVTAAVYDMKDSNRLTTSATNPLDRVQVGEVSIKGVELEGQATIAEDWMFTASFAYTDAKISKSNTVGETGKRFDAVPKYNGSVWGMRRFALANDAAIRVGGGVRYTGKTISRNNTSTIIIRNPSYTLADFMASYEQDDWRLAVNINNLFDKDYDSTCLARGDCFIGARRSIVGSITKRF